MSPQNPPRLPPTSAPPPRFEDHQAGGWAGHGDDGHWDEFDDGSDDHGSGGGGGRGILTGIIYLLLFVVVAAVAGIGYLTFNPPSELIRRTIAEQVKSKTGRDLVMAGPASFVFFPSIGVSVSDVSLSGPPGSGSKLVAMKSLEVSVKPIALIQKRIDVSKLVLKKPVFDLRIDKEGRRNWQFALTSAQPRYAELQPPNSTRDFGTMTIAAADDAPIAPHLGAISDLHLDDVRIEDGAFSFTDERIGKSEQVSAINAKVALPSLQSPATASGNLKWRGQQIDFDGKIPDVTALLAASPARLSFGVQSANLRASYDGGLAIKDGVSLDGRVTAESPSTRELAKWFGTALPPVSGFGPLSIQGVIKTADNVTTFSNALFGLDGATAKGTIKVTTGGVRPLVDADLAISELDLNKYLTTAVIGSPEPAAGTDDAAPDAVAPPAKAPPASDQIEQLLNKPATKVYGSLQRAGWSSEPFNVTLLNVADGTARLQIGKLLFKNIKVGRSDMTLQVKDRAMRADFGGIELYDGHGQGVLDFSGGSTPPAFRANFNLDGLSAQPFLTDAADFGRIAGKAKVSLQLSGHGVNQLQMVETLSGTASFNFADGAIVGFNVPGAIRSLSQGSLAGLKAAPTAKTDFASMQATFGLTNGVAENTDLQLLSPLLRVAGSGAFHLPERTVDYTVKPKIVASLEGQQTADNDAGGIEVPVRISGAWDSPRYQPDLKDVLGDPNKTLDTIKSIGKQFKGKSAGEIVNDLFGKKDGDSGDQKPSAGDILKKLFKKPQDNN